jgi:asparagine synthase (glutamine-hydrolysing)
MCGLAVVIRRHAGATAREVPLRASQLAEHRGPDDHGLVYLDRRLRSVGGDEDWIIALAHRRLSILDLSENGRQPMNRGGDWIVYNGEVYNYVELRRELEGLGHRFRTGTDTEVVLAAYRQWGRDAFRRFRGMWALVLVDGVSREVILSRDRFGMKPLYVVDLASTLFVCSEPKQALALLGQFDLRPNRAAVTDYLFSGFEDQHRSFFDGVVPCLPGTCSVYPDLGTGDGRVGAYWEPAIRPREWRDEEAEEALVFELEKSVAIHARSDVPVGCALSGGLDSSAVTAMASRQRSELDVFSVVFPGFALDESRYVEQVGRGRSLRCHFVKPTPQEFLEDLDLFVWTHDEPVGSASQYAGYAMARRARNEGVPVVLTGQGGDEVLGGYWQTYFAQLVRELSKGEWSSLARELGGALGPGGNRALWTSLPWAGRRFLHRAVTRSAPVRLIDASVQPRTFAAEALRRDAEHQRLHELRELTLPRLLRWDDRNFMAASVEGRYPLLDPDLVELCLSFPGRLLRRDGWLKWVLRRVLARWVPASVAWRRDKVGFETPQGAWFRALWDPMVRADLATVGAPVREFVDVEHLLRRSRSDSGREQAQALFRVFLVNRWLRVFDRPGGFIEAAERR